MRTRLSLAPKTGEITLPKDHRHILGATLHRLLRGGISHKHTIGLSSFSPLFWRNRSVEGDRIRFLNDGYIIFSSVNVDDHKTFYKPHVLEIENNAVDVKTAEIEEDPTFTEAMQWKVHRFAGALTQEDLNGKKRFVSPYREKDKAQTILANSLRAKWKAFSQTATKLAARWVGKDNPEAWAKEQPVSVHIEEVSSLFTHYIHESHVHAWGGVIRVQAPVPFQRLIWAAGIGAKTQMGFGFCEPVVSETTPAP